MLLRRVLRRRLVRVSVRTGVPRRVLRGGGGCHRRRLEGARRQKHALSQTMTPSACALIVPSEFAQRVWIGGVWNDHLSEA